MIIYLKKKQSLQLDVFNFKCSIGKNGLSKAKVEGDLKTPIGTFSIENLYYRSDRVQKPKTNLKCIKINENMGWCDDPSNKTKYNKLIKKNVFIFVYTTNNKKFIQEHIGVSVSGFYTDFWNFNKNICTNHTCITY